MSDKVTVVRYTYSGDKFELLVKPDPAFDYKIGKISEISKTPVLGIFLVINFVKMELLGGKGFCFLITPNE